MTGTVLSVLTGAPGSGKTASLAAVRQRLAGVVVVDMDAFLDAGSALAGADLRYAAGHWMAYTELCRQLVATVLDSGVDCLLLTPLEPREVPSWPVGEVRWAVLDCPDPVRRRRLARRGLPRTRSSTPLRTPPCCAGSPSRSSRPPAPSRTPPSASPPGSGQRGTRSAAARTRMAVTSRAKWTSQERSPPVSASSATTAAATASVTGGTEPQPDAP
jgi:hypothetical protein